MAIEFDPTEYVHAPRLDVASAVSLAIALITSAPADVRPGEQKALKTLRAATVSLQQAWAAQDAAPKKPDDPRPADKTLDGAWAALLGRLESYAMLPSELYASAAAARTLVTRLFPQRLAFTQLPYAAEWAESDKRLTSIDEAKLGPEIDALCGADFLVELRRAHTEYGKALGIADGARGAQTAAKTGVAEPLRSVSRAIQAYATQLSASVDGDIATSATRARAALGPIDKLRAGESAAATATDPVPDVK